MNIKLNGVQGRKIIVKDKDGYYIMMRGTVYRGDLMILNVYVQ